MNVIKIFWLIDLLKQFSKWGYDTIWMARKHVVVTILWCNVCCCPMQLHISKCKKWQAAEEGNVLCHASMNIKNHESMCALINEVDGGNTQHCNITFVLLLFQEIIISRSFYVPTSLLKVALNQVNHIFWLYDFNLREVVFFEKKLLQNIIHMFIYNCNP